MRDGAGRRPLLSRQHTAQLGAEPFAEAALELLCCYNRVDNDTFKREDDRYYVPLHKVPDSAIKTAGLKFSDGVGEHFASKPFVPKVSAAE